MTQDIVMGCALAVSVAWRKGNDADARPCEKGLMVGWLLVRGMMDAGHPRQFVLKQQFRPEADWYPVESAEYQVDVLLVHRLSEIATEVDELQGRAGRRSTYEGGDARDETAKVGACRNREAATSCRGIEHWRRNQIADFGQCYPQPWCELMRPLRGLQA
ncbi:hypothetical protein UP10_20225 [Bradyrhizobium sp. LTSPM299]|nr:hypothetical protein UP10_20225 [Bradyrhizobium sp. LTSPM299]